MFAGIISREKPVELWGDSSRILNALAPFAPEAPRTVWSEGRMRLWQVNTRTGAVDAGLYRHAGSGLAVAFWGRLDARAELHKALGTTGDASDGELTAQAWLKWGESCPEHLLGDFAFAVADARTGTVFLARDPLGVKPLVYRADADGLAFATTAAAFKPLHGALTRDTAWLARHAMGIGSDRERTPYLEVLKLPPGHSLLTVAGAAPRLRRYHVFDAGCEPAFRRDAVWLEAYREAWREAVACRLPVSANIGAHHSGGLDSGTITAEIARSLGADIHRLYGFSHCHYQIEPELVMLTAMRYRMPYNLLVSGISALNEDAMTRELLASGHPNDYYYPRSMYCFHDEAKAKGVAVMFSGVGGDEGVTSFAGEAYAELAAQRDWRALSAIIPGPPVRRAVRMARFLWRNRKAPSQAIDPFWAERWAYHILDDGLVADIGLQERYRQQGLSFTRGQQTVNGQTIAKLEAPFLACRLEALAQFGASYGLDYAFPLLDVRLLRLWLSAPLVWKRGPDAMPRYLHRCANQGVFPEELLWRRGKDLGMSPYEQPRSQARNAANARLLLETAEASPPVLAEVFDAKKIRRLADRVIKGGEADLMLVDFIGQHQMILMSVNHWLRNDSESG